jgi:hypothetical protein
MNSIQFGNSQNKHQCQSKQEGEWVVFRCPHCPDYERRIHSTTGKMTTKSNPDNLFLHTGNHIPPNLEMLQDLGSN